MHLPVTSDETIKNFLRYKLAEDERSILKFGLNQPIELKTLKKTYFINF